MRVHLWPLGGTVAPRLGCGSTMAHSPDMPKAKTLVQILFFCSCIHIDISLCIDRTKDLRWPAATVEGSRRHGLNNNYQWIWFFRDAECLCLFGFTRRGYLAQPVISLDLSFLICPPRMFMFLLMRCPWCLKEVTTERTSSPLTAELTPPPCRVQQKGLIPQGPFPLNLLLGTKCLISIDSWMTKEHFIFMAAPPSLSLSPPLPVSCSSGEGGTGRLASVWPRGVTAGGGRLTNCSVRLLAFSWWFCSDAG